MSCGSEIEANRLFIALMDGRDFNIPIPDFSGPEWQIPGGIDNPIYQPIARLTVEDLTTGAVDGSGVFDKILTSLRAHLRDEFDAGRITSGDYVKAYIAMIDSALANSVGFLTQRDQAFWAAALGQIQAITGKVALVNATIESSRLQLEALTSQAGYALTKLKLSTESLTYCTGQYNLEFLMPLEKANREATNTGVGIQNNTATYQLSNLLPAQLKLVTEQTEAQRAQTLDTRSDGQNITGVLGKQKDLYAQQITSYQRDAEVKAARMFSDVWITQKTIDEDILTPEVFANASVNTVFSHIKTNNNLS